MNQEQKRRLKKVEKNIKKTIKYVKYGFWSLVSLLVVMGWFVAIDELFNRW